MIDYLVPDFFITPSTENSGGMHTKVERVRQAVGSIYRLQVGSDLSEMRSEFLLIEPLYFRMSQMLQAEDGISSLEALRAHPATKILYCSEMEMFRWTGRFRKELLEICDAITCNSDYQASLFGALAAKRGSCFSDNITDVHRLIDPIPADAFQSLPKRLQVVAMGRISEIKGSPFIAELFKRLEPTPIETVFVGGAGLWGEASEADLALEEEIREYTDLFHQNILPQFVPKAIGPAAFFVGNSIHDVFSSSHAEALMSGCISISGEHPIYAERPGFKSKTVDGVVERIQQLTEGFQRLPDPQLGQAAREWAVQNVSFETFTAQLTVLLKSFY